MSELQNTIESFWQYFVLAPLAFVSHKIFSLNSRVSVNENKIKVLEETCTDLCKSQQKANELLAEISGTLKEHLRSSTPR